MRALALLNALLLCATTALAADCASEKSCDSCAKESEFSWNPENQFATPKLQRFYALASMVKADQLARGAGTGARVLELRVPLCLCLPTTNRFFPRSKTWLGIFETKVRR